jgi:hypothetical protein
MDFRQVNVTAISRSPFTLKQQVIAHPGQVWEVDVQLPKLLRSDAAQWVGCLSSLYGSVGTFLLGDPDAVTPRGTISAGTLTGVAGSSSPVTVQTGTLLAGDYIQLGTGSSTKLHMAVQDRDGDGVLEIWPALRQDYTAETMIFTSPKGLFRKADPVQQYSINEVSSYGVSFTAIEVL